MGHPGYSEVVNDRMLTLIECKYHQDWRAVKRLETSSLPESHRHARLDTCETATTEVIEAVDSGESLYVYGESGSGKTLLVSALGNELITLGRQVEYITAPELILKLSYSSAEHEANLRHYQEVNVLIIDDVGVERQNQYSGEQLSMVLEGRRRRGLQTLLTSEASRLEIATWYAEAGVRRVGQLLRGYREIHIERNTIERESTE